MSNVLSISAIELVEKLKSGEISCVDACKEYIKRIDKFDKEVKAWAFFDKKLLLEKAEEKDCLLYTSPSPRDRQKSRMPSSA